ncbi:MAG: hypothetical protein V4525_00500 [Pseudomonadota bacterium]
MSVSSVSVSAVASYQQGLNSGDPVQEAVSGTVLKRSQQIDKQTIQALLQSTAPQAPVTSSSPGDIGHAVNVYA